MSGTPDGRHGDLTREREEFFAALATADRDAAVRVVETLVDRGVDGVAVLQDVVCAAQVEVGRRWQVAEWSVAKEHAATAISEAAVAAVGLRAGERRSVPQDAGHVVVACVEEEWHALPARVLSEVLGLRGWRTTYLGASTPTAQMSSYLEEVSAVAVALSCSLATGLPRVRRMIEAVHEAGVLVLTGGPAFGTDGELASRLGADAWAPTAAAAAAVLADPPARRPFLPPFDHDGLDEHAELDVSRPELVARAFEALERRFPPLRSYERRQVARTREDLGHILDFLGAALFVEEPAIFHRFTAWLQDVLVCRGVDERALALSYAATAEVLESTPRARALLGEAAEALPRA